MIELTQLEEFALAVAEEVHDYLSRHKFGTSLEHLHMLGALRDLKVRLGNKALGCLSGKHSGADRCKCNPKPLIKKPKGGFTLIELMLVVTMIGVLAAIATPKLSNTIRASQEARTKGNLATLRAGINGYMAEMGRYPTDDLGSLILWRYLDSIPLKFTPPYHPEGNTVSAGPASAQAGSAGDWFYVNSPTDTNFGAVMVNCVHTDLKGKLWTTY